MFSQHRFHFFFVCVVYFRAYVHMYTCVCMYIKENFFFQLFLSLLWSIFVFIVVVLVPVVALVSLRKTLQFLQKKRKISYHSNVRRGIKFVGNKIKKKNLKRN